MKQITFFAMIFMLSLSIDAYGQAQVESKTTSTTETKTLNQFNQATVGQVNLKSDEKAVRPGDNGAIVEETDLRTAIKIIKGAWAVAEWMGPLITKEELKRIKDQLDKEKPGDKGKGTGKDEGKGKGSDKGNGKK